MISIIFFVNTIQGIYTKIKMMDIYLF